MEGLDKLRESVLMRARKEAEGILQEAEANARRITDQTEEEIRRLDEEAEREAASRLEVALTRSGSLAELDKRKILLEARQEVIQETLDQTLARLTALPDETKIKFYVRLLRANAQEGQEVRFSRRDEALVPAVLSQLPFRLVRGPEENHFSGGFVLREGRVTWRFTFEELLNTGRDDLVALAAPVLFGAADGKDG